MGAVSIRRKVIQIANSTQLVSLPRKWSLKYNIQKGDELEVEEKGSDILITTDKEKPSSKTEINFKGRDSDLIHRALSSQYRAGYDEIKIFFEKPLELEMIQNTKNEELIGFEIVEEGRNYLTLKRVSNIEYSEFDPMLRRSFVFLLSVADECLEALKSNDVDGLRNLIFRDKTINKLTNYCRRSLNKKEIRFKHIGPAYVIIEMLEKIGDGYRDICKYAIKNKINLNEPLIDIFMEVNALLREFYNLFYNFNLKDMGNFLKRKEKIDDAVRDISKNIAKDQIFILSYLEHIALNTFNLNGPLMLNAL